MDRARVLWYLFLGLWASLLAWHGGVSVPATAMAAASVAVLNLLSGRLLGEPVRLSGAGVGFLGALGGLFVLQLLPDAPVLFPVTARWRQIHGVEGLWPGTADTYRTLLALSTLGLYALSTVLVVRLRQAGVGASVMIRSVVAILALEATYGLFQEFAGLRDIPFGGGPRPSPDSASGTLIGRNNFAGLMAVGFVLAVALAWGRFSWPLRRPSDSGKPRWMRSLEGGAIWALAAGLFSVGIVVSHSRGGALSALGGAVLLPFIYRGRASVAGAAALALVAIGAVSIAGLEPLLERFGTLDPFDLTADARWTIFRTTFQAALHQPVLGFGFGSHPEAYHPYQPVTLRGQIHHAHNEYVNLFFESGLVGLGLLLAGLGFWAIRGWRAQRPLPGPDRLHVTSALGAVAVTALHSFVDFDLRIPACGMLFAALIGIGAAASRDGRARPRLAFGLALAGLAAVASLFVGLDAEALIERARGSETGEMERLSRRALGLSPYEYRGAWTLARAAQRRGDPTLADRRYEIAADLWPAHPGVQHAAGIWFWEARDPRATVAFRRLFEQDPSQVAGVMGEIGGEKGRDYESLLPASPAAVAAYASWLVREGDWPRGLQVFEKGVPRTAAQAYLYDGFAWALDQVGQWGVEATILDRRLEVKSDAGAYAASARAWLRLGVLDRALERSEMAARIDLGNASWTALKGDVLRARGDRLSATEAYTEALAKAPMELSYREARGWTYLELRMWDPAAEDFKAALRSRPQDRSLVLGLAQALAGLGQTSSARLLLDDYLRKSPEDAGIRSYRDSLPP